MSGPQHHATVDKGLKMKIKRNKTLSKSDNRHEGSKNDSKTQNLTSENSTPSLPAPIDKTKGMNSTPSGEKSDKTKLKSHKKDKGGKDTQNKSGHAETVTSNTTSLNQSLNCMDLPTMEPKVGDQAVCKRDTMPVDPYEFNAKIEDASVSMPMKKVKLDKMNTTPGASHHSVATETCNVGVATEPECLGPCEPGTSVTLEGIVWHETEQGVLVVNVTWRGKTYVGTLLDATKHDWAPPRLGCDSPVSDVESRTPKGRGKRGRTNSNTPVTERSIAESRKLRKTRRGTSSSSSTTTSSTTTTTTTSVPSTTMTSTPMFQAPPSPAKSDTQGTKRKSRPADLELSNNNDSLKPAKRTCSNSRGNTPSVDSPLSGNGLIECPEPHCNKKYKHINGLRYHQAHSHPKSSLSISTDNILDLNLAKDEMYMDCTEENGDSSEVPNIEKANDTFVKSSKSDSDSIADQCDEKIPDITPTKDFLSIESDTVISDNAKNSERTDSDKNQKSKNSNNKSNTTVKSKNPTTTPVTTKSSTSPGSQVFQISSAPIGCLGSIYSQCLATSTATITTTSVTSCVTVCSAQVCTNTMTVTTSPSNKVVDNNKDDKHTKVDKTKGKGAARPIMPAPTPQLLSLSTNVNVTHSNLAPVSTHAQSSPSLKPIQPKPTIMGEPSTVNPALTSLKDKKPKSKKKKDKDKDKDKSKESKDSKSSSNKSPDKNDMLKNSSNSATPVKIPVSPTVNNTHSTIVPHTTPTKDTNDITANDKSTIDDDVHSPAYSDISDVNEVGSPQASIIETPTKEKEQPINTDKPESPSKLNSVDNNTNKVANYGMYTYYNQPQYLLPGASQNSPNASAPSTATGKPFKPNDSDKPVDTTRQELPKDTVVIKTEKDESKTVPNPQQQSQPQQPLRVPMSPSLPQNRQMTPQQVHEYNQQKWMQQVYALQSMPAHHYQYMAQMGYPIDQNAYHMGMMAQDPNYRQQYERAMEDRKRLEEQHRLANPGENDAKPEDMSRTSQSFNNTPKTSTVTLPSNKPTEKKAEIRAVKTPPPSSDSVDVKPQIRDKHIENRQILKENIEIKSQMDKSKYDLDALRLREREEEMRRYYMMQMEQQRTSKSQEPAKTTDSSHSNTKSRTEKPLKVPAMKESPRETSRKESHDSKDNISAKHSSTDSKHSIEDRQKHSDHDRHPQNTDDRSKHSEHKPLIDKSHSHDPSKHRSNYSSPNRGSPAVGTNPPVTPNIQQQQPQQYPYMQYPYMQNAYGQIHYDHNHPMYQGVNPVMNFQGHSYLHPSQLGYRPNIPGENPVPTPDDRLIAQQQKPSQVSPADPKALDMLQQRASQYYGLNHKIHELQEKARPVSPGPGSGPKSVETKEAKSGDEKSDSSPPPQRHVHTHHHTHVVGGFPIYPTPYSAILPSQQSAPTSPSQFPSTKS